MSDEKIRVTLVASQIGRKPKLARTIRAMGLRRPNNSVVLPDTADVRTMIKTVEHLVRVEAL